MFWRTGQIKKKRLLKIGQPRLAAKKGDVPEVLVVDVAGRELDAGKGGGEVGAVLAGATANFEDAAHRWLAAGEDPLKHLQNGALVSLGGREENRLKRVSAAGHSAKGKW